MMPVELAPEVLAEVDEAARWYDAQRPGLGRDLVAELDAALARLAETATSFPRLQDLPDDLQVRRCLLSRFPYGIVFTILPDRVRVVAFAHLKRRPGYWLGNVR